MSEIDKYNNRAEASKIASDYIQKALINRLSLNSRAGLVVSGGSTPLECLTHLSHADLEWCNVSVTLSDERCVPVTDAASNERMVRENLLINRASASSFVALQDRTVGLMPKPFACSLLGMGEDGHFASLFPDTVDLSDGLDLKNKALCMPSSTAASPHKRITMTLSLLVQSDVILLLVFGATKRKIIEAPSNYPIASLLAQDITPVRIIWAP